VPVTAPVRTNYTLTEPDGTTTKLNEPGAALDRRDPRRAGRRAARARRRRPVGGALRLAAPGTPVDWYADLVRVAAGTGARIAVDTSEEPLLALLAAGPEAAPDLLKPNSEELAQLAGVPEDDVLADPAAALAAVRTPARARRGRGAAHPRRRRRAALHRRRRPVVGPPPRITVRSTVGAGDCSLAGYLLADLAGAPPAERLRTAVAYGAASASLPGSAVPTPAQVDGSAVRVTAGLPSSHAAQPAPVPAAGRDAR
jgi:1-phosphofructokinase